MEVLYLEEVDSTNKYAKENIACINDNTIVYTFNQTAGRGRMSRKWSYLGEDNIYASIVLKPSKKCKKGMLDLTLAMWLARAKSYASCTFDEQSIAKPVCLVLITSLWSQKMFNA